MKRWIVGMLVGLVFFSTATPVNRLQCEPIGDIPFVDRPGAIYEFDHSFSAIMAMGRESERRLSLCGDSLLWPTNPALR
jgi:hypothetical protein